MAHGFWGFPSGSWEQGQFLAFCDPQKWFPLILSVVLGSLPVVRVLPYSAADRRGRPADLQSHLEAALSSPALRPVSSRHVASRMSSSISSAQGNPSAWPGVPSSTLQPRNSPQEEKWGSDRAAQSPRDHCGLLPGGLMSWKPLLHMGGPFFQCQEGESIQSLLLHVSQSGTLSDCFLWQWYLTVRDTLTDSWLILTTPLRDEYTLSPQRGSTDCLGRHMVTGRTVVWTLGVWLPAPHTSVIHHTAFFWNVMP